ncbi:MAG: glycosyltransferase [Bacteroidota bacterium]
MIQHCPLITVIALCYNHEKFVVESLQSVVNQDYGNIELIIVDDCSDDGSQEQILKFSQENPTVKVIFNPENLGNCRSFNQALKIAKGKYVIDLATDDVLLPNRITEQVRCFEISEHIGVVFSDAEYIDENSKVLGGFYLENKLIPQGNIYKYLLKESFIMPSSMMIRKSILDSLGGYDETLSYEDFDFWIRSSRICEYAFVPKVLVQQRIVKGSHSTKFYEKNNPLIRSTFKVCQKALSLNETEEENQALIFRLRIFLRKCFYTQNFAEGREVIGILKQLRGQNWLSKIISRFIIWKISINFLYIRYINLRKFLRFKF